MMPHLTNVLIVDDNIYHLQVKTYIYLYKSKLPEEKYRVLDQLCFVKFKDGKLNVERVVDKGTQISLAFAKDFNN